MLVLATPLGFLLRKKTNILRGLLTRGNAGVQRGRSSPAEEEEGSESRMAAVGPLRVLRRSEVRPGAAPSHRGWLIICWERFQNPPPALQVFAQDRALQKLKPGAGTGRQASALPSMGRPAVGGASRRR